ncbi:MAG: DUF368 domain-containing protein [Bacilli bacterium]|nr:DUF368 domain-containing protein [Bacilli bacterium]
MIKNIIGGIVVGMANIIPGVSGGTMLVILGMFDKLMQAISNIFKFDIPFKERINNFLYVLQILIGAGIGLVAFAKILTIAFEQFELQTIACFTGLILLSLPNLKKQEIRNNKINYFYFILGIIIIAVFYYISPKNNTTIVTFNELINKNINLNYSLTLITLGIISGATMIFPGVSGSMILLVLGYYHLFKGYVANVTSFNLNIIIPLILIAIGVIIGIVISAKITTYLLKKFKNNTMSLIFGLITMSVFVIIPLKSNLYTLTGIITSILSFIFGGLLMYAIDELKTKKLI